MRINSQNNQFLFNLPQGFISNDIEEKFEVFMDKNFVQYNGVMDYLNSTIKDLIFPSISYERVKQTKFHGKNIAWRESGNVIDKFQNELDITFRSVDSHLNYFILLEICNRFYLQNDPNYMPELNIKILDKDGDVVYTILLKDLIISSLSELRLAYYATDFSEQTFSLQIAYNYMDILWSIDRDELTEKSIFDLNEESNPRDVSGLEEVMRERKMASKNRIGK
ncbi:MAG: hypothetical protein ACOCVF_03540 [bacterium]